jgi:hypothetical protein
MTPLTDVSPFCVAVIHVQSRSWVVPLPDNACDVRQLLQTHNGRVLLKQHNSSSALLPVDSQYYPHRPRKTIKDFLDDPDTHIFSGIVRLDNIRRKSGTDAQGGPTFVELGDLSGSGSINAFVAANVLTDVEEFLKQQANGDGNSTELGKQVKVNIGSLIVGRGRSFVLLEISGLSD